MKRSELFHISAEHRGTGSTEKLAPGFKSVLEELGKGSAHAH